MRVYLGGLAFVVFMIVVLYFVFGVWLKSHDDETPDHECYATMESVARCAAQSTQQDIECVEDAACCCDGKMARDVATFEARENERALTCYFCLPAE